VEKKKKKKFQGPGRRQKLSVSPKKRCRGALTAGKSGQSKGVNSHNPPETIKVMVSDDFRVFPHYISYWRPTPYRCRETPTEVESGSPTAEYRGKKLLSWGVFVVVPWGFPKQSPRVLSQRRVTLRKLIFKIRALFLQKEIHSLQTNLPIVEHEG